MTAAPALIRPKGFHARYPELVRHGWHHWGYHVVPSSMLRDFILEKHQGQEEWREQYWFDMASILGLDQRVVARRMRDVMSNITTIVRADYAEAATLALDLYLDRDTNIPTLPGNLSLAKEMILLRTDEMDEISLERHARIVRRICALIVGYPHHVERLLDLAPFNCLRQ